MADSSKGKDIFGNGRHSLTFILEVFGEAELWKAKTEVKNDNRGLSVLCE